MIERQGIWRKRQLQELSQRIGDFTEESLPSNGYFRDCLKPSQDYLAYWQKETRRRDVLSSPIYNLMARDALQLQMQGIYHRPDASMMELSRLYEENAAAYHDSAYYAFLQDKGVIDPPPRGLNVELYSLLRPTLNTEFAAYADAHGLDAEAEIGRLQRLTESNLLMKVYKMLQVEFDRSLVVVKGALPGYDMPYKALEFSWESWEHGLDEMPEYGLLQDTQLATVRDELDAWLLIKEDNALQKEWSQEGTAFLQRWRQKLANTRILSTGRFELHSERMIDQAVRKMLGFEGTDQALWEERDKLLLSTWDSPFLDFLGRHDCLDEENNVVAEYYLSHRELIEQAYCAEAKQQGRDGKAEIQQFMLGQHYVELLFAQMQVREAVDSAALSVEDLARLQQISGPRIPRSASAGSAGFSLS